MADDLDLTSNEMPKASAAAVQSGSNDDNSLEVIAQKNAIVELSNQSVLRGYDMAIDLLLMAGHEDAAKALLTHRDLMEIGLKNTVRY